MNQNIKDIIKEIIEENNPGLLPDEVEEEMERILYGKDIYQQAMRLCGGV